MLVSTPLRRGGRVSLSPGVVLMSLMEHLPHHTEEGRLLFLLGKKQSPKVELHQLLVLKVTADKTKIFVLKQPHSLLQKVLLWLYVSYYLNPLFE